MKKLFIAVSLFVAAMGANAQDYKPVAGDVTGELGLVGGLNNLDLGLNNGAGQLRFRYFVADQIAARVGLNISSGSNTTNRIGDPAEGEIGTIKSSYSNTVINLGVEKHFTGSERLSTYVGADILISFAQNKEEGTDVSITGDAYNEGDNYTVTGDFFNEGVAGAPAAGSGFGLRVIAGADYYIVERVYIGGEFGWGFISSKAKEFTIEGTDGGDAIEFDAVEGDKNFVLTPQVVTGVRLGFRF